MSEATNTKAGLIWPSTYPARISEAHVGVAPGTVSDRVRCAEGRHGPAAYGTVRDFGEWVNRDIVCAVCGAVIGEQSWTKAAWLGHLAKEKKRRGGAE